ncbi:hypothetical protein GTW69_40875, partial [Streptomyces sp. SID7760]|nr:hypothetical protein [Streptomyces sp. SID7760]
MFTPVTPRNTARRLQAVGAAAAIAAGTLVATAPAAQAAHCATPRLAAGWYG